MTINNLIITNNVFPHCTHTYCYIDENATLISNLCENLRCQLPEDTKSSHMPNYVDGPISKWLESNYLFPDPMFLGGEGKGPTKYLLVVVDRPFDPDLVKGNGALYPCCVDTVITYKEREYQCTGIVCHQRQNGKDFHFVACLFGKQHRKQEGWYIIGDDSTKKLAISSCNRVMRCKKLQPSNTRGSKTHTAKNNKHDLDGNHARIICYKLTN